MTCTEIATRLESVLAGDVTEARFPSSSTVRSHLDGCANCRGAWERVRMVLERGEDSDGELDEAVLSAREALRQRFGAEGCPPVRYDWLDTPIGSVFVAVSDRGVCGVTFDASTELVYRRRLATRAPEFYRDESAVEPALSQLDDYFSGRRRGFSLATDLRSVSDFTSRVLTATGQIQFGTLLRYGDIAQLIGSPAASRAVGGALGRNPVPIVVPCHRVVAGNGIGGFTGGLATKRALLAHEGHGAHPRFDWNEQG